MATEGELLAGDHTGVVWQQCGSGLGEAVRIDADASLAGTLALAERLLDSSYSFLRDRPKPKPGALYPSGVQATMPEPTDRDKTPILSALDIDPAAAHDLAFEAQFPTGLGRTPPRLDLAITDSTGFVVGIENKFTEHLKRSTKPKSNFRASYFPESGGLWARQGLPACQELAEELWGRELSGGRERLEYLVPRQLLKHALGLAKQRGSRFSLYYLYYDWSGSKAERHRTEVGLFTDRVGPEIRFKALTCQEVNGRLRNSGQIVQKYLDYLATRYFERMP